MAGTHSKSFSLKDELAALKLRIEALKSINLLTILKIAATTVTVFILISSIIVTAFFSDSIQHGKLIKHNEEIMRLANGKELGITTLRRENKDVSAWLTIEGAGIDNAVCTAEDDYYKNHDQNRRRNRYGTLYMTDGDVPQRVKGDQNLVIYGNNMPDGSMFGSLKEYRKLSFYKENSKFFFHFGDIKQRYIVFAVTIIDGENPDFDYTKSSFSSEKEFNAWCKKIYERSIIETTVAAQKDDRFLTLVTDANDFKGAKLVVMARMVDDWESVLTDISIARINTQVKYPEKWYKR